jgi:proteasome-associated ATPase
MSTDEPRADESGTRERLEARARVARGRDRALAARGQGTRRAAARPSERDLSRLPLAARHVSAQNERLVRTLRDAREQIVTLKSEVDRLAQPPAAYGIVIESLRRRHRRHPHRAAARCTSAVSPSSTRASSARPRGHAQRGAERRRGARLRATGEVVSVKEILDDGRVLVVPTADEERVCRVAASARGQTIRAGDALLLESALGFVFERIPKAEVADLVLEEVPDIDYTTSAA